MKTDNKIPVEIPFPAEIYAKLQYIARCENRTLDRQVLSAVRQYIYRFENLNGRISPPVSAVYSSRIAAISPCRL